MAMRLDTQQGQRLVMTPQLQLAIQLLQLSTLELEQVVRKELEENPLLEELPEERQEVDGEAPTATSADGTDLAPTPAPAEPQSKETSSVDEERAEDLPFENLGRTATSLAEHLEDQLRLATDDPRMVAVGEAIIGNLDEDGYLRAEVDEIAKGMGVTSEEVVAALRIVQGLDPTGVAARSVQECLLLQLTADAEPDPVSVEIVEKHFEDLERRRYADIARTLKLSLDRIMESVEEIQGLEPKPGRRFSPSEQRYIAPDVSIHKVGDDYVVVLNEEGIPRLRVNALYRSLLRRSGDEARLYVEQKLRSAVWLIKSVEQRQRTLRKVTQSLVKFQRDFLDRGVAHLRPLALRDVGEDIGMHESTISRVTTNKYVETPQGLFELKYFFHSGIASDSGEMVSSVSIKKTIRDMVAAEDSGKPLSDQEVAQVLRGQGLNIARRTVAKYREELGIMPSHQRRLAPKKR